MTILQAFRTGGGLAWSRIRLVPVVYLIHLLTILIPAFLFFQPISDTLGHAPVADRMTGSLDLSLLTDLLYQAGPELGIAFSSLWALAVLIIVSDAFIDGGLLAILLKGEEARKVESFFEGGARFILPFLRLFLLSCLLLILAAALQQAAGRLLEAIEEELSDEVVSTILMAVRGALFLILMAGVNLVLDYAKVSMVLGGRRSALSHLKESLAFIWGHKVAVISLYTILAAFVLLLHGGYLLLSGSLSTGTWPGLLLLILLQQLFILSRTWTRLLSFSAQGIYFKGGSGAAGPASHPS